MESDDFIALSKHISSKRKLRHLSAFLSDDYKDMDFSKYLLTVNKLVWEISLLFGVI